MKDFLGTDIGKGPCGWGVIVTSVLGSNCINIWLTFIFSFHQGGEKGVGGGGFRSNRPAFLCSHRYDPWRWLPWPLQYCCWRSSLKWYFPFFSLIKSAGRINREFRAAQWRGAPLPILWISEYFTLDGEDILWGRSYRLAGFYAWIMVW